MKFSLSSVFLTLLGASYTLATPITKQAMSPEQNFGILTLHSGNINVHQREFYVGQSGHVFLSQYDNADGAAKFHMKNNQLYHNNDLASIEQGGALVFKSSGPAVTGFDANAPTNIGYQLQLNGSTPVACPVPSDQQIFQVYYGQVQNGTSCVGIDTIAIAY
ncbi:But2 family protein [Schizosaccharomyces octosporus yFS286]|uniref:But2 family protein n=1 Tax=Schizosaccharomyces octosporus (strain yFS286) TaxID=483514 RepID=S9PZK5_SCHOY|nr:But2 family protein [Schizosaccharomyces octosporus yFS286]EPX72888.1 But2 family protein [Schizosaccharomyces octosporus yFS286]